VEWAISFVPDVVGGRRSNLSARLAPQSLMPPDAASASRTIRLSGFAEPTYEALFFILF